MQPLKNMKNKNLHAMNQPSSARYAQFPRCKLAPLVLLMGLPLLALADTKGVLSNPALDPQSTTLPYGGPILAPFKYIPPIGPVKIEEDSPKRNPDQQRIVDLNAAGNYQAVGTAGMALLAKEKPDEALQLIIANSLAWTGRLKEAVPAYQSLTTGKYANDATVGLANVQRWRGRDDEAMPLYRKVLASDPSNEVALEGVALSSRELSPRTLVSFGGSSDSSDMQRRSAILNHRWRDSTGSRIMEVETAGVNDRLPNSEATQQDVTVRYEDLNMSLKPSIELSMPTRTDRTLYGSARIKFGSGEQVSLTAGRVNWGRMASNPNALAAGLVASHIGMTVTEVFSFGTVQGRLNYYDISDNNELFTTSLNLSSTWRPIGKNFKPFIGIETRGTKFNTPNYWSPAEGSGTLYAGLMGEWGGADWNFYASGQSGARLYGDAGASWSFSAGGKRWLSKDVALSMSLWSMASTRDNATYRAQSANVNLEKLWP